MLTRSFRTFIVSVQPGRAEYGKDVIMIILNSIILSVVLGVEQFFANRQSKDWADYHQHVEFINDRIREKWRQRALYDVLW